MTLGETTFRPEAYDSILQRSLAMGFSMRSDVSVGTLLKTLACTKPAGNFLELGTGTGLALSWMLDGMGKHATITSIDNDPHVVNVAKHYFDQDRRVTLICADAEEWIVNYKGKKFDLVFADAWPGKYSKLDQLLLWLQPGGLYVIDDMIRQDNWPEGHELRVRQLLETLEQREDLMITKLNWSTGIVIAVKK